MDIYSIINSEQIDKRDLAYKIQLDASPYLGVETLDKNIQSSENSLFTGISDRTPRGMGIVAKNFNKVFTLRINGDVYSVKTAENSEFLSPRFSGRCDYVNRLIVVEAGVQAFETLLHEIAHCYLYSFGDEEVESFNKETLCSKVAAILARFITENGSDIFEILRAFLNARAGEEL